MLYESLGSFGVNVELIKKLGLSDEELAAFEGRLADIVKKYR